MRKRRLHAIYAVLVVALLPVCTQAQIAPATAQSIDAVVNTSLNDPSVPSVSLAIVQHGRIVYAKAYGFSRLESRTPATVDMRYKIGSNTKQFVAAAMMLLVQDGKLSLDDKVAQYLPELTRANEVTIRQLLSHTAGYVDYYPLDYLAPYMARPTTVPAVLSDWGKRPLGFEPGTRWEYSNTGYMIAGRIIEIAGGMPLTDFIRTRMADKLGMQSVVDTATAPWEGRDPEGYDVAALGPPRPARPEGKNWLWAAGNLAMTATDLARWDIGLMHDTVLTAASRKAMTTDTLLADGIASGYGLGLFVHAGDDGRLRWDHGGEASGFRTQNTLFPDDDTAIVVLTNGTGAASATITSELEKLLFPSAADPQAPAALAAARSLFVQLQDGHPDRSVMTDALNAYFSKQTIEDFAASLKPLGSDIAITQTRADKRGGLTYRFFKIKGAGKTVGAATYFTPEGKIAQFIVYPR
ncbi:beta-lactamase family protein [Luteibacter pinisoli]|uniref:Beta-lactamase family protein n=1 Tax=Luteibacter pinisoli TaxID=2589080 RepID=A0A4Y5Z9Q4_9GAMM|nr:serine hydrolase domain-containing protein [Luteibacter pinisoli]QDE40913.1 beta-lactamase family protein [Luteibacter pinisoli]